MHLILTTSIDLSAGMPLTDRQQIYLQLNFASCLSSFGTICKLSSTQIGSCLLASRQKSKYWEKTTPKGEFGFQQRDVEFHCYFEPKRLLKSTSVEGDVHWSCFETTNAHLKRIGIDLCNIEHLTMLRQEHRITMSKTSELKNGCEIIYEFNFLARCLLATIAKCNTPANGFSL